MEKYFEIISNIRQNARESGVPILRDESVKLIKMLVAISQPKQILEIGTAVGYSGIEMLSQCKFSHLTTIEKDENSALIAKQNFSELNLTNRVTQYTDDAINILQKLDNKFDFIFLDGPKAQYIKYLPMASPIQASKKRATAPPTIPPITLPIILSIFFIT